MKNKQRSSSKHMPSNHANVEDRYHDLLCRLWEREISADEAMEDVQDLINSINELRNAALDCMEYGETDKLELAVWNNRDFAEGDQ